MKVAVSSCGIFLDSPMDPRFGRCDYFLIIDTRDMSFEVFENQNAGLAQGAGIHSATFVVSKGAQTVITENVGANAIRVLSEAGVPVAISHAGSVREALDLYMHGKLRIANSATVKDNYGKVGRAAAGLENKS